MASVQRDHWSYVWLQCLLLSLLLCRNGVLPDVNNYFHTSTLCLHNNVQAYKQVDGAVVTSENEDNMECVVTFQTDSILQRFMLRFEHLALDCNDHLYIFDGARSYGKYEHDLSCRSTRTDVGTIFTQSSYVTLKYITDSGSPAGNGFKLVITAVKKPNVSCKNFRCLNDLCISQDLTCDGINHCADNSDETSQAYCVDENSAKQILGIEFSAFVTIIIGIFLICSACVVGIIICICRKETQQRQLETQAQLAAPQALVVGHPAFPTEPIYTMPPGQLEEKPPPYPGNPCHPSVGIMFTAPSEGIFYHVK